MKKILILGGTTYDEVIHLDHLPDPTPQSVFGSSYETIGSTGAGKALSMTKLGIPNTLHSILGNDSMGKEIIHFLQENGVDFLYDFDNVTEKHVNLMDKSGERISIFVNTSNPDVPLDISRLDRLIQAADLVVLNIIGYTKRLIPMLAKYQKEVWTDLHDYLPGDPYYDAYLRASAVVFFSSDRLPDYKTEMEKMIRSGKRFVVCTHGKKGATLKEPGKELVFEPVIDTYRYVDANGAGDNFFSGFLYGYLKGCTAEESMCYATIAGGLAITTIGLVSPDLSADYMETMYQKIYGK